MHAQERGHWNSSDACIAQEGGEASGLLLPLVRRISLLEYKKVGSLFDVID